MRFDPIFHRRLVPLLLLAAASCTSVRAPAPASATDESATIAEVGALETPRAMTAVRPLESFDAAWTTVRDQHFDPTLNGVDWDAVRAELRPKMESVTTQEEARAILMDMLSRLGQSHFTIIPAEVAERSPAVATPEEQIEAPVDVASAATARGSDVDDATDDATDASSEPASDETPRAARGPGTAGIDVALVEGVPTVLRVASGLPADRAGVRPGWRVTEVDGQSLEPMLEGLERELAHDPDPDSPHARELRAQLAGIAGALLSGSAGTRTRATFEDVDGGLHEFELVLETAPFGSTKFGNLPALPVEVESRLIERRAPAGRDFRIGLISFNIWMTSALPVIDRAVDQLRRADGIVIDLRGNPGGVGAMSMGVAGHFLQETASLGSMITRESTLEFRANPRKVSTENKRVRPYSKPLAILVDGRSGSTSEVFAAGLQGLGRARVFGETSAGMALPAIAVELPSGDVLMHAIADFKTPRGSSIEGVGVIPDQPAVPTRRALSDGQDAALEAAIAWISETTLASRSARDAPPAAAAPAAAPSQ